MTQKTDTRKNGAAEQAEERPGLGATLRDARKRRKLSVDQLADELRLESRLVHALEEERFEEVAAPVFARGYLRQCARTLGLDADELLREYDRLTGHGDPELAVSDEAIAREAARRSAGRLRFAFLTFIPVALVAGVIWWSGGAELFAERYGLSASSERPSLLPNAAPVAGDTGAGDGVPAPDAPDAAPAADVAPPADVAPAADAAPTAVAAPGNESSGLTQNVTGAPAGTDVPATPAAAAELDGLTNPGIRDDQADTGDGINPGVAVDLPPSDRVDDPGDLGDPDGASGDSDASADADPLAPDSADPVDDLTGFVAIEATLTFIADSWAEVTDARGVRLVYDLGAAGEQRTVVGAAPLDFLFGNYLGVSLDIDGQPWDIPAPAVGGTVVAFSVAAARD